MDKRRELLECIKEAKFDDAKARAFQLIQIDDDTDGVQWALDQAIEYKDTVTYKIVEKMLKYI